MRCPLIYSFTQTKVLLLCQCDYKGETLQRVCRHLDNMLLLVRQIVSESLLELNLGLFLESDLNSIHVNLNAGIFSLSWKVSLSTSPHSFSMRHSVVQL